MSMFLMKKVAELEKNLPEDLYKLLHNDASLMSALCVENEEDFKNFYIISTNIRNVINSLTKGVSEEEIAELSNCVYNNRKKYSLGSPIRLYIAVGNALKECGISIKKMAYPQGYGFTDIKPPHNIENWLKDMREIYAMAWQRRIDLNKAFEIVTEKWDPMDKLDFKHWLSYYQSNEHLKYKTAQVPTPKYYQPGEGAMIPTDALKARVPGLPYQEPVAPVPTKVEQATQNALTIQQTQEDIKKKLIGRLTAAERVYTANVDMFRKMLGAEYERWLAVLHDLKRKIQIAMPVNAKSSLFEDLIIKEANKLQAQGLIKSASIIRKFAQEAAPPPVGADPTMVPPVTEPDVPPDMGTEPMPELKDMGLGEESGDEDAAMEEFVRNLTGEVDTDENDADDLVVKAQAAPAPEVPAGPTPEEARKPEKPADPNISDDEITRALENVTIDDVIAKLDGLAQLYRNREKTRQLTIVDLQMQHLGISSYFPSLAEAINKAFDSNQYILTRIEDVLSRLRGAVGPDLKETLEKGKKQDEEKLMRKNLPTEPQPAQPGAPAPAPELAAPTTVETPPAPAPVR